MDFSSSDTMAAMLKLQSLKNKKGEVLFRKKLARQFLGKGNIFKGELSYQENISLIRQRIKDYTSYFERLLLKDVKLGPYLEIGSGICQGAMYLENRFGVSGFASDISYHTLSLSTHYKKILGFKKMPIRICCDTYNLPFKAKSIPFIFCFETLHHFPDPLPVLKEIKRVLAPGGVFYFNEEPIAQIFNLNWWRRDWHLRWYEKFLKVFILLHFISKIGKSEVENDILEETFTLQDWERALNQFDQVEVVLKAFPFGPTMMAKKTRISGWINPPFLKRMILQILGGGIEALCQIDGQPRPPDGDIFKLLACPNCIKKPSLEFDNTKEQLFCRVCKRTYESKNGIFFLLTENQKRILYPKYSILQL